MHTLLSFFSDAVSSLCLKYFLSCSSFILSVLQKCQALRFITHQHPAQDEVHIQTEGGQNCLLYNTCASSSPVPDSSRNLRPLNLSISSGRRQGHPQAQIHWSRIEHRWGLVTKQAWFPFLLHTGDLASAGDCGEGLRMNTVSPWLGPATQLDIVPGELS